MASVHDVAAYILEEGGPMTAMKLEKLVYYAAGVHLARGGGLLFPEPLEAWSNGPVCPELYSHHRGRYKISSWPEGDVTQLAWEQEETVKATVAHFADATGDQLRDATHEERPWQLAREGIPGTARSHEPITTESLQDYFTEEHMPEQLGLANLAEDPYHPGEFIPISTDVPNAETIAAFEEVEQMIRDGYTPRFSSVDELWEALTSDIDAATTVTHNV